MFRLKRRQQELTIQIGWIEPRHFPAVLAIERAWFADPWTQRDFDRTLKCRGTAGLVAELCDRVAGFVIFRRLRPRRPGRIEPMEILDLVVAPSLCRRGIARKLVESIERRAGLATLIGERNLDAQLFFRRLGFRATRILTGYFRDGQDAYGFVWKPDPADWPEDLRVQEFPR